MENETQATGSAEAMLPRTQAFEPINRSSAETQALTRSGAVASAESNDRTGVFQRLVNDDADIAGLVAYSIYKQNKLDWLRAFEGTFGRAPNDAELASYIIGEGTPRRLATYRHLAEATLAGHGPDVDSAQGTGGRAAFRRRSSFGDSGSLAPGLIATYVLIAILFVFGFWLAAHFTMSSR